MTIDQLFELGTLAATIALVMAPFHVSNVKARSRLEYKVDRAWRMVKRHARRTRGLSERVSRLESGQHGAS